VQRNIKLITNVSLIEVEEWLNKAFRQKIIDIQSNRRVWYKFGCSLGILEVNYRAADLESFNAEFSELDTISETTISLSEAARSQIVVNNKCKCKTDCSTICSCQKADKQCGLRGHPTNSNCVNH
jgi:hypothetical protein